MANVKITELPGYIELDKANDLLPIVDKLNTETKKITADNLVLSYAATGEEIDAGVSDEKYITPKALFDSTAYVSMSFMTVAYNGNKPLSTLDEAYQDVPNEMEGYTLVSWSAMCVTPSDSGDIVFSVTHDGTDMFTSPITIDEWGTSSRTSTHQAVINPFNNTLSAGKVLHFSITSNGAHVTFAKVTLGFRSKNIVGGGSGGGSGDVVGPSSAIDDDIVVFDGTSGKVIKDSGVKITDIALGDVQGPVHSYDRDVPIFDGTTGKIIEDSGITIDELKDHNQLDNLQGGDATAVEFFHLTQLDYDKVVNGDFGGGDYPQIIDILPDEDESEGKKYKTVQAAVDYLSTLLPITIPWAIRIYGFTSEDLIVSTDLLASVQIIGQAAPTNYGLLFNYSCGFSGTVTITDTPTSDGQICFRDCSIINLVLTSTNGRHARVVLNDCIVGSLTSDNSHCSIQASGSLMNCADFSDGTLSFSNGILTGTITGGTITATNVFWGTKQPTGGTITVSNLIGFAGFWFGINTGTTWKINGFQDTATYNGIRIQTGASLELYYSDMHVEVAAGGTLTTINCTGSVTVTPGGTWTKTGSHNDHFLTFQGGDAVLDEYYHLTADEHSRIEPATDTTLGVVKIGDGLTVEPDGTINAVDPILDHNLLEGLQGGDSTSSEFYHLTETEYIDVQNALYVGEWEL